MKQNHGWLKARDLNRGTGSLHAVQLSGLVRKHMEHGGPPLQQDIGGSVTNIEIMLESLASMMGAFMQDSFDGRDINNLDLKIKIFLNDLQLLTLP
jgi:hypothetical protein